MEFGPWQPLARAVEIAPEEAGIYQLRLARGLIDYPRGKSAMVRYGSADSLRLAAADVASELPAQPEVWFRHTETLTASERLDLGRALHTLIERFEHRFGARPTYPREEPSS